MPVKQLVFMHLHEYNMREGNVRQENNLHTKEAF